MSASLSLANLLGRRAPLERGLDPELLLAEGILGDPKNPEHALRRARALSERGHYKEARALLLPHLRSAPEDMQAAIAEQLAVGALHTGAGDLQDLLATAYAGFEGARDLASLARVQRLRGDCAATAGRLHEADMLYDEAAQTFAHLGDTPRQALVLCRRARLRELVGDFPSAQKQLERALGMLEGKRHGRAEGLARLDLASVLAHMGDGAGTAKQLIAAERLLGTSPSRSDGVKTRLMRAETLMLFGETERAIAGLKRLLVDTMHGDDVLICARVERLLGEGLAGSSPSQSRSHLMRARHLYESTGADFMVARCDLELAHVERHLGLNPEGRVRAVASGNLAEWGVVAHEVRIVRAAIMAKREPERARSMLLEARAHAEKNLNRRLLARVDKILRDAGLIASDVAPLDNEDTVADGPVVQTGTASLDDITARGGQPGRAAGTLQPYDEDSDGARVTLNPRLPAAARFISPEVRSSPSMRIHEPRPTGALRQVALRSRH